MFFRKKNENNAILNVESLNYNQDTDKILITLKQDSKLSSKQIDEIISMLDNIFKYKTIKLPNDIKDMIILHNPKE